MKSKTPEYRVWSDMRQRCKNPSCKAYKDYGARGIRVCERWDVFENFLASMGLLNRLFRREPEFVYGTAGSNNRPARKHKSGRVEFVMWKAGEQGHERDYWIAFHEEWWPTFKEGGQHDSE